MILAACSLSVPSADELDTYLDRVEFGSDWVLLSVELTDPPCMEITETCPRADRVYRVPTAEFPATDLMIRNAGFENRPLFQTCVDSPAPGCRAIGWEEDVAITMTIVSTEGSEAEVLVRASRRIGPEPVD